MRCEALISGRTNRHLAIQFHLECGYICLTYYEYNPAKENFTKARELSGIDINMTGMFLNTLTRNGNENLKGYLEQRSTRANARG